MSTSEDAAAASTPTPNGDGGSGSGPTKVTENMTEYCAKLEAWLWQCYYQRSLATSAYFTALSSHSPVGPTSSPTANNNYAGLGAQGQGDTAAQDRRQRILMFFADRNRTPGAQGQPGPGYSTAVVAKLAPVWKRLLAEIIDFLILLFVKLFITFTVIDSFELIDLDGIDLDAIRQEVAADGDGDSPQLATLYELIFSLTSELLLLELTHRIVVCFFEAYCVWKAGGTPGKTWLGLRVIHAEDLLPVSVTVRNNNGGGGDAMQMVLDRSSPAVMVRPGTYLSFPRALLRSVLKNFSLAFFFPLAFTLFHFDHSRTLYDIFSHSVVVEYTDRQQVNNNN